MANMKATAGSTQVSFTLTSGARAVFPASTTSTVFMTSSDLTDLQRSGLIDAAIAGGKLSLVVMSFDDGGAYTSGTSSSHAFLGRQLFSASGTYTPTAGCNRVIIRMVGAGGGGGGVANSAGSQTAVGGGGASGDYLEKFIDPGAGNYPLVGGAVTIGAAGTAGANTGAAGGTGGNTTVVIAGVTYTAKGGTGGSFTGSSASAQVCAGGASQGGSSTGDVTVPAEPGIPGSTQSGTLGTSGAGGNSPIGSGGAGKIAQGAGTAGAGAGAGGSGALSINAGGAVAGGAGTAGYLVIDEYT